MSKERGYDGHPTNFFSRLWENIIRFGKPLINNAEGRMGFKTGEIPDLSTEEGRIAAINQIRAIQTYGDLLQRIDPEKKHQLEMRAFQRLLGKGK